MWFPKPQVKMLIRSVGANSVTHFRLVYFVVRCASLFPVADLANLAVESLIPSNMPRGRR